MGRRGHHRSCPPAWYPFFFPFSTLGVIFVVSYQPAAQVVLMKRLVAAAATRTSVTANPDTCDMLRRLAPFWHAFFSALGGQVEPDLVAALNRLGEMATAINSHEATYTYHPPMVRPTTCLLADLPQAVRDSIARASDRRPTTVEEERSAGAAFVAPLRVAARASVRNSADSQTELRAPRAMGARVTCGATKLFTRTHSLSPGIITFCDASNGTVVGFSYLIDRAESPRVLYEVLRRFKFKVRVLLYDNNCHGDHYLFLRAFELYKNTLCLIDKFHWANHVDCSPHYSHACYERVAGLETDLDGNACEHVNSVIRRVMHVLMFHGLESAVILLSAVVRHYNCAKLGGQARRQLAPLVARLLADAGAGPPAPQPPAPAAPLRLLDADSLRGEVAARALFA